MTRVVVVTAGGTHETRQLSPHLTEILRLHDVDVTGVALRQSAALTASGVEVIVLDPRPVEARRASRAVQLMRHATFRSARWLLWQYISKSHDALRLIGAADIVLIDGPNAIYAGWRIARRFPQPWVILDGHGVKNLLTNR